MIKPLFDRILVSRDNEPTTVNGLIIPDTAKEKPAQGFVVAVGQAALHVKKGDIVMFGKYAGTEVKMGSGDYLMMREEDVLGIVEETP